MNQIKCPNCKKGCYAVTEIQKRGWDKTMKWCHVCIELEDKDIVWINSTSETRDESSEKTKIYFQVYPRGKGCIERKG
jgi:hypothetical protein